jgi:hypothetical protein
MQAILMFLVLEIPGLISWTATGMPTDRTSISILIGFTLGAILAFIKEILGGGPATPPPTPTFPQYQAPTMTMQMATPQAYTPPPTVTPTVTIPSATLTKTWNPIVGAYT